jgi:ABC-type transporter Mla subunit MlaD
MGYREDPEARSTLSAAFTGLGLALVFLAIVAVIAFAWAGGFGGGH